MSADGPPADEHRDAADEIVDAALQILGDAPLEDLLRVLTPERIAADGSRSASTVRYHFGGRAPDGTRAYAFQRRDLALAMLVAAMIQSVAASADAAGTYLEAVEDLPRSGSLDHLFAAVARNLAAFSPGASDEDVSARERMRLLAVATSDDDVETARLLRRAREQQLAVYLPVYEALLRSTDRELRPGHTLAQVADAMYALIDGHLVHLRFDPGASSAGIDAAVVAILAAATRPRGRSGWDAAGDLLGAGAGDGPAGGGAAAPRPADEDADAAIPRAHGDDDAAP